MRHLLGHNPAEAATGAAGVLETGVGGDLVPVDLWFGLGVGEEGGDEPHLGGTEVLRLVVGHWFCLSGQMMGWERMCTKWEAVKQLFVLSFA